MIDLCYLDEAGFAPTLPVCYSGSVVGGRLVVPYEAPQGRRVNAMGAYFSHGVEAGRFCFELSASLPKSKAKTERRTPEERAFAHGLSAFQVAVIDGERLVAFFWKVAERPAVHAADWKRERPLVIVLDNYSVHRCERVQQEREALARAGVTLFYLPSYSPELSDIEPVWQATKHHEMPQRSYEGLGELWRGVHEALTRKAADLLAAHRETANLLRAAA